jgi:heat-inducible transcriptional repressor
MGHQSLIKYFRHSADELFDFEDWEDYYLGSTRNILRHPEFTEVSRFENLMEVLENKHNMIQFLEFISNNNSMRISIGKENSNRNLETCSVVASDYLVGNVRGVIGIIGPTRMDYGRMVSIVNYMSEAISNTISN